MNRWLYRAAGTVGIAGGFLLLGAGGAQADEAESAALLDDVFSPTSGLPPLDLPDTLSLAGAPLDAGRLPGAAVGAGGPLAADALRATDPAEVVGPMPHLTKPLTGTLLGGGSLGDLVTVGDLAGQVPVAGPIVSQTTGNLPLVSDVVPNPHRQVTGPSTTPQVAADPLSVAGPIAGTQLAPLIGEQLAAERGYAPEVLDGGLPLVGQGLGPVGQLVGVGNLANQLPLVGPLAAPMLGGLPVAGGLPAVGGLPATVASPGAPASPASPGASDLSERPVAGEDPEYG